MKNLLETHGRNRGDIAQSLSSVGEVKEIRRPGEKSSLIAAASGFGPKMILQCTYNGHQDHLLLREI